MTTNNLLKKVHTTGKRQWSNAVVKSLILLGFLIGSFLTSAQDYKFSVEANYPFTFGDNFIDEGYNGVADLGFKYRLASYENFDFGASFNTGAFIRDDSRFNGAPDVNGSAFLFQLRAFTALRLDNLPRWHPMVGIGYSIFVFNIKDENFAGANFQENSSDGGINLNLALAYDIAASWFLKLQYDYIKLSARNVRKTPFNQNVNIIKIGAGYRF